MNDVAIATTPGAMVEAQAKLLGWIEKKLAACELERREANSLLEQLRIAHAATTHADRVLDACRRRERFYEKVRAAIAAGYYIVPPFDCQVFAIRTDREFPPREISQSRETFSPPSVPTLPAGDGRYVGALPARSHDHTDERPSSSDPSKKVVDKYFSNDDWKEVEFPVRAMHPSLIEASTAAMNAKIFDALAIAPAYRSADPIIVGRIKHWRQYHQPLHFFVAWWLDYDDL